MASLEYEELPQMQSLTPEPDTGSLKDGEDGTDIIRASPCKNDGKNETITNGNDNDLDVGVDGGGGGGRVSPVRRACSPLYSYNKYDLKEMDLIEVLWKQDVDLGFTLTPPTAGVAGGGGTGAAVAGAKGGADSSDDLEKLKVLLEIKNDDDKKKDDKKEPEEDPWAGLSYTIDTETGEYVLNATDDSEATLPPPLADLFLEEELNLPELINDAGTVAADVAAAAAEETGEPAKKKTTAEEEEEESEVKRIERELETSADELCQGAVAAAASATTTSVDLKSDESAPSTSSESPASSSSEQPESDCETCAAAAAAAATSKDPLADPDDPEAVADDLEDLLCDMMIQTSSSHFQHPRQPMQNYGHGMHHGSLRQGGYHHHHHHHHHHQSRVPLSRAVSMEQRFQDVANLLGFPPGMGFSMGVGEMAGPAHPHPHYPSHHYPYQATGSIPQHAGQYHHHSHAAVLQNASLAELGGNGAGQPYYAAPNLGSAVASSMHLTNSTSETDAGATGYKMEHDMMYYSNTSSEMNHTDGFLNSILDDDLQLIDIPEGMYTMRMLDPNATSSNSSVLGGGGAVGGIGGPNSGGHLGGLMSSAAAAAAAATGAMQHGGAGAVGGITSASTTTGAGATGSGGDRLDASSDSAVSSMGSERVPSLSDGEWGDGGSDSAQEYHNKYGGPYDYSYSGNSSRIGDGSRQAPVAQKKHQMFGKRFLMEQNTTIPALAPATNNSSSSAVDQQLNASIPIKYEYDYMTPGSLSHLEGAVGPVPKQEDQTNSAHNPLSSVDMKYPYSLDFARQNPVPAPVPRNLHHDVIHHNHTYTLPHNSGANPKPQTRDKKIRKSEEEHLTRDEKRARALNIPITVQDIINLPMDEFNERLSKYDLSETQLSLIRDIRRRGKNKVAAQNCRKRKLDQIVSLADEVKEMKNRKERLLRDREHVLAEQKKIRKKYMDLYRHIFEHLRDDDGNPISMEHYTLQQRADGPVMLLPRSVDRQQELAAGTSGSSHHHHHQQQQQMMMHHHGSHHHHHQQQQQHHHLQHGTGSGPSGSGSSGSGSNSNSSSSSNSNSNNSTIHSQHRPKE